MPEIEFFDPDDPLPGLDTAAGEEIGREPTRSARFDLRPLTTGALFAGAVALALVAPFQPVYELRQRRPEPALLVSADGWGRVTGGNLSPVRPGFHEPRYGIALSVGTGLLACYLLVFIAHSAGSALARRIIGAATVAAVAATGLTAGVFAAMWLVVDARFAAYRSSFVADAAGPPPVDLGYGTCLWLVAAAAVAAALGLVAVTRRPPSRPNPDSNVERHG